MNKLKNISAKVVIKMLVATLLVVSLVLSGIYAFGADSSLGSINQNISHSEEESMYLYTLVLNVKNPVNTNDCDSDAICDLKFVFSYKDQNGYGSEKSYTFDMSYRNGRNMNENFTNLFKRKNDNGYKTMIQLWVPGIVSKVKLHLNMDGGERLEFSVDGIYLNGFRADINTDYVSSAYYDSDGEIRCSLPDARVVDKDCTKDCYGGVIGEKLKGLYNQNPEKYGYYG